MRGAHIFLLLKFTTTFVCRMDYNGVTHARWLPQSQNRDSGIDTEWIVLNSLSNGKFMNLLVLNVNLSH